jgi:hypothetical protein
MATQTITTWVDGSGLGFLHTFPSPGNVPDLAPGAPPWNTYATQGGAWELHVPLSQWPGCLTATAVTVEITLDTLEYLSSQPADPSSADLVWVVLDSANAVIASGLLAPRLAGPGTYGPFTSGPVALTAAQAQAGVSGIISVDVYNPVPRDVNLEGGRFIIDGDIDACVAAADPIPVDNVATIPPNTPTPVDVSLNDNNTPCGPLPGCAVFREAAVFIDPSSTAGGIVASIDAAGVVTFEASGVGVAILNIESGCSATCDPLGADVVTWVPQTLTVTVAEPEPVPVDNTAVGTVGTPAVVDVSLNDNNTACDPLPGCAVYNTTVVIEPGSTAGGITASVDSAGVATVNATSAGTAIVTIESGCSPTCDPLGTDVTTWVPQTLTVTFSEPVGPCQTVNAIYDPGASASFAGFFGGTAGGPGGPTGQGSQGPTISVYQVAAPSVCVATISNVQVQTTVTASPGFDPTNDHLTVAVVSDLTTFTIWGTPTAVSGQANITFPGAVSSGYTSGGGTLVPLIDATWSGGPSTSPIYIVVVADASESAPGESIAGSTPVLCVEFGDPDCPPAPSPKPADIVKLCVAAAPQAGCATFGGVPSPTLFVAVSGPDGNVIPANSTSYPSNSVGGSDGSGYIRSYYTTTSGLVVTPDAGSWTPGSCGADALQLPAGAVSIANGTYAATLGPNGSNWFPPSGLKSVTVYARHAATNDDATASGSPGRVEVFVNGNVFMMLDGESFTWSVDDPDDLTTLTEVRCTADAAATVTWVSA